MATDDGVSASHLFVYGTLRRQGAAAELLDGATFLGFARVGGRLVDLGDYPGLVLERMSDPGVQGELYQLRDPPSELARLDEYEGYGDEATAPHEFERVTARVHFEDGTSTEAWTYVYRGSLDEVAEIPTGHWRG